MMYLEFTYNGRKFAVVCEDSIDAGILGDCAKYCFNDVRIKKRVGKDVEMMSIEDFDSITDEIIYQN